MPVRRVESILGALPVAVLAVVFARAVWQLPCVSEDLYYFTSSLIVYEVVLIASGLVAGMYLLAHVPEPGSGGVAKAVHGARILGFSGVYGVIAYVAHGFLMLGDVLDGGNPRPELDLVWIGLGVWRLCVPHLIALSTSPGCGDQKNVSVHAISHTTGSALYLALAWGLATGIAWLLYGDGFVRDAIESCRALAVQQEATIVTAPAETVAKYAIMGAVYFTGLVVWEVFKGWRAEQSWA